MELILWRHCDAVAGAPDARRALSARGHDEARRMAAWLTLRLPSDCRILASPAVRAQQTVQALKRSYTTVSALAPGATIDDVLQVADWPGADVTTLIVGHEPTLGDVANYLLGGSPRALDKGAAVWMTSAGAAGTPAALKAVIAPNSLR